MDPVSAHLPPVTGDDGTPLVYADGSALARFLADAPEHDAWTAWVGWLGWMDRRLVTSPLGATELRSAAAGAGPAGRLAAADALDRVTVLRVPDQALVAAANVAGAVPPFVALHLGMVRAYRAVDAVATYETDLARVCALHRIAVVSPGRPAHWWEGA